MPKLVVFSHPEFERLKDDAAVNRLGVGDLPAAHTKHGGLVMVPDDHFLARDPNGKTLHSTAIPNVYAPHPNMRIEASPHAGHIARETAGRVAWLHPNGDGSHQILSVGQDAFGPLKEYLPQTQTDPFGRYTEPAERRRAASRQGGIPTVSYTAGQRPGAPTTAHGTPTRNPFALQPFAEAGAAAPKALVEKPPAPEPKPKATRAKIAKAVKQAVAPASPSNHAPIPLSDLAQHKANLEQQYHALPGNMDDPHKIALVRQIADTDAALGLRVDAAHGYLQALWEPGADGLGISKAWLASEDKAAAPGVQAGDFARPAASDHDARRAAAKIIHASFADPASLASSQQAAQAYLEQNDHLMPPRAAWLAWNAVSGGDPLAVARSRDRILGRLLDKRAIQRAMPSYQKSRSDTMASEFASIADAAAKWNDAHPGEANSAASRYLLAFAAAKAGDHGLAIRLHTEAESRRDGGMAHDLIHDILSHRVQESRDGQSHNTALPAALTSRISGVKHGTIGPYHVNRFREHSWVAEPMRAASAFHASGREFARPIAKAETPEEFERAYRAAESQIGRNGGPGNRLEVASMAISALHRGSAAFAQNVLQSIPSILDSDQGQKPDEAAKVAAHAIRLAAHYGMKDLAADLLARAEPIIKSIRTPRERNEAASRFAESASGLRAAGLGDLARPFLRSMESAILDGRTPESLASAPRPFYDMSLAGLSSVAAGWNRTRDYSRADAILNAIEPAFTLGKTMTTGMGGEYDYPESASRYVEAAGLGDASSAADRLRRFFAKGNRLPGRSPADAPFPYGHVKILDSLAKAVADDSVSMSETAKRLAEEDEFLMRRRIHSDMAHSLNKAGIR